MKAFLERVVFESVEQRGKIPVFGMLKRGDKVYTQIVKNCSIAQLMPIITGKADTTVVIYSDGLADFGKKALSCETW